MIRAIVIVLAGGAIGAVSSFLIVGRDKPPVSSQAERVAVSEQLAAYRAAATVDDIAELESALRAVAAEPAAKDRDLAIDATLIRLAGIDPAAALNLAVSLKLESRFVVAVLVSWAHTDSEQALQALAAIDDHELRRATAHGMLDVVGDDPNSVDRIVATLPEAERANLIIDALVWRAKADPLAAMQFALDLQDAATRRRAVLAISEAWVHQDPTAALREAETLPVEMRAEYRNRVSEAWARTDPRGYFDWLEANPGQQEFSRAVLWLAGADPERSLRVASLIGGEFGNGLRTIAEGLLVQRNPGAALVYAQSLSPGPEREQMMSQVAMSLGAQDPDAALRWLESQPDASAQVQAAVYSVIVQTEPGRVAELLERLPAGVDARLMSLSISAIPQDPGRSTEFAESLIGSSDERAMRVLSDFAFSWVREAPEHALAWIEANSTELDSIFLANATRSLIQQDTAQAAAFVDRLLPEQRGELLATVAASYARSNPTEALSWVARHQGQPGYASALRTVATRIAPADPQSVTALVAQASIQTQLSVVPSIASAWAARDPAAAAQWARTLGDSQVRSAALNSVVTDWADRDLNAASRWAMSMPRGEVRDEVLALTLSRAEGDIDPATIDAFSSDIARQRTLVGLMLEIARRNPDEAHSLLDAYLRDPGYRQQAEEYIRAAESER